ncbi:hypothetical protein HBI24_225540 [Parastagonospora nodorum]|nr:hypothetical protein HBH53_126300 [Parastagonospora nodorum]KAH4001614.1 hypothetical protein HBI10_086040 [Parastagonospora nodorum]KAH4035471.1 hypothetical protein HBI09_087280 [Parastagonospora nodorum]KAH4105429.1 hypothetical protein HBH46_079580 [Parastagonospora nodorum]KAH4145551.1 hypothetical protein HBH45_006740 [Parastagonospora nodorum]
MAAARPHVALWAFCHNDSAPPFAPLESQTKATLLAHILVAGMLLWKTTDFPDTARVNCDDRLRTEEPSPSVEIRGPASAAMCALAASSSASLLSLVATPSYQVSIASSGLSGKHSLGSTLGKRPPDAGSTTSYFSTARCKKGTCSSGPNSSCIVCHVTKPCFLSAVLVSFTVRRVYVGSMLLLILRMPLVRGSVACDGSRV